MAASSDKQSSSLLSPMMIKALVSVGVITAGTVAYWRLRGDSESKRKSEVNPFEKMGPSVSERLLSWFTGPPVAPVAEVHLHEVNSLCLCGEGREGSGG